MKTTAIRYSFFGILWMIPLLLLGCDSSEDGKSDSELFVGRWELVEVEDSKGDQTPLLREIGTLTVTFDASGNYSLVFDAVNDALDQSQDNTYVVNETTRQITLNTSSETYGDIPVVTGYTFTGENQVRLQVDNVTVQIINTLLSTNFTGSSILTFERN